MIVITEIKLESTKNPRQILDIYRRQGIKCVLDPQRINDNMEACVEMIKGRRFVNSRGEKVCIGISEAARDIIGLEFEVIENLKEEVERLESNVEHLLEFAQEINLTLLLIKCCT